MLLRPGKLRPNMRPCGGYRPISSPSVKSPPCSRR